jgi:hypothetical protein
MVRPPLVTIANAETLRHPSALIEAGLFHQSARRGLAPP